MTEPILNLQDTLAALPPEWPEPLLFKIKHSLEANNRKLVVLDDDPTGTQTVHSIPVLTEWSQVSLRAALKEDGPAFYILTNSRSLPADEAHALNIDIGQNLQAASNETGIDFAIVSRSDSTLRGHFPLELDALSTSLNQVADVWLIIPFFLEGGRYTVNDVHYVAEGNTLIPAAQTPFAQDKSFGYTQSNLRQWVTEKSAGRFPAQRVDSITIKDLRVGGPSVVKQKLMSLPTGSVCVVNSASYQDQDVFVAGLLEAEAAGQTFMYRTAASFVRARAGVVPRELLTRDEMVSSENRSNGGLVVVGSYVPKTTQQLNALFKADIVAPVEIRVSCLLDETTRSSEITSVIDQLNQHLNAGRDAVVYTSRELIAGRDAVDSLTIGNIVSASLVEVVKRIVVQPRYLIAKGGITSSDVATKALHIRLAMIMGQILPGIPVWQAGPESRYPGMAYVVFPGNVGDDQALLTAVNRLR